MKGSRKLYRAVNIVDFKAHYIEDIKDARLLKVFRRQPQKHKRGNHLAHDFDCTCFNCEPSATRHRKQVNKMHREMKAESLIKNPGRA